MNIVDVPLADIEEAPFNYNLHPQNQIDELRGSLEEFGQFKNIVLWKGYCIAGNGLTFAARSMGWKSLKSIIRDDLTEEQAKRLCVADNATPYLAMPDSQKLEDLLKSLPSFDDIPGVNEDWLNTLDLSFDSLLDTPGTDIDDPAADEVPDIEESITKLGELWQLGDHRLLCGDATKREDVERLLDGEKADIVFTDPPYGMNAVSKSGVLKEHYKHDIMGDDDNTVAIKSFKLSQKLLIPFHCWWGANYYTETLPSAECWIVWDKNNGGSDQTDCELAWSNFRSVVRKVTMVSEKTDRVHPTQKPVALIIRVLDKFKKFSRFGSIVDFFGGSGSTLIACEKTGRKCFMMELDPHYCTVIIKRWEQYTGKQAVLLT